MNPNTTPTPGFELPTPVGSDSSALPEYAPMPELSHNPSAAPASQAQPVYDQPIQSPLPASPASLGAPMSSAAISADDSDLIEKEWVEKAKSIVASTRHDPQAQNRELGKFKADYLQKRYNKTLKVDET